MEVTIICDSLKCYLPKTVNVSGKTARVTYFYVDRLLNIAESLVVVHADDTIYEVKIPSSHCKTADRLVGILNEKLKYFAQFSLDTFNVLQTKLRKNCSKIEFPSKLLKILGFNGLYPVDPELYTRSLIVCAPIVENSLVGVGFLPTLCTTHPSAHQIREPIHRRVVVETVNFFELQLYDASLDPVELGAGPCLITIAFQNP